MKTFKNNQELIDLIDNNEEIIIDDDISCHFNVNVNATIIARNIKACNIDANDIKAYNIDAFDIKAYDIKANSIKANNIKANNIKANNIKANNIDANDIKVCDIKANSIKVHDIDAFDIKAYDIDAVDIKAVDIDVIDINARNIDARKIDANNIIYYSFCISTESLKCESISGRRENSIHKCLDNEIEFKQVLHTMKLDDKSFKISGKKYKELKKLIERA